MKMRYVHVTICAYFLTETLNCQVLWGKDKYWLNSFYEKLENKVFLKQMERINSKQNSKELSLPRTNK